MQCGSDCGEGRRAAARAISLPVNEGTNAVNERTAGGKAVAVKGRQTDARARVVEGRGRQCAGAVEIGVK